jgi:hypothetical protein
LTNLITQPRQSSWLAMRTRIGNLRRAFVTLVRNHPSPTPEQEAQHDEAEKFLSEAKDKSYKFNDVFFKSVSWLVLIGVLDGLRGASGYGVFYILEAVSFFSFMIFASCRLLFPVTYVIRFFGRGSGPVKAWITALAIAIPVIATMFAISLVIPVAVKKVVYVQHCASSSISNPVAGCPAHKKHSSLF